MARIPRQRREIATLANTLLEAAGNPMVGLTVPFESAVWPHHTDPRPARLESQPAGHCVERGPFHG